jgi:hypothetical protein
MSDQNVNTIHKLQIDGVDYVISATYLKNGDSKFDFSDVKTINGEAIIAPGGGDIVTSPITFGEAKDSAVLKGGNNKATNANEVAIGRYNESNNGTQFSIGIGTSVADRKNAVEVKQNGDIYITGIGGFTGANSSSSQSVQEVINELVDIINQITIKV